MGQSSSTSDPGSGPDEPFKDASYILHGQRICKPGFGKFKAGDIEIDLLDVTEGGHSRRNMECSFILCAGEKHVPLHSALLFEAHGREEVRVCRDSETLGTYASFIVHLFYTKSRNANYIQLDYCPFGERVAEDRLKSSLTPKYRHNFHKVPLGVVFEEGIDRAVSLINSDVMKQYGGISTAPESEYLNYHRNKPHVTNCVLFSQRLADSLNVPISKEKLSEHIPEFPFKSRL